MKFTSAIVALSAALTYADDLPSGAHDDRPQQARPNVCDDKCDVAFMKWYEQYKDQTDGVQLAREKTCKNDYTVRASHSFDLFDHEEEADNVLIVLDYLRLHCCWLR